jgi:hypothetical protein
MIIRPHVVDVDWANDDREVIVITVRPGWRGADWAVAFVAADSDLRRLLDTAKGPVDVIVQVDPGAVPPTCLAVVDLVCGSALFAHPNAGIVVTTGRSGLLDLFAGVLNRRLGGPPRLFPAPTPGNAVEIVREHREHRLLPFRRPARETATR